MTHELTAPRFPDQLLQTAGTETPPSVTRTPNISPSPALPNPGPVVDSSTPADDTPSTHVGSLAPTITRQANYRPRPTKKSIPVLDTKKCKHTVGPGRIRFFEDPASDEDEEFDDPEGDGSSSGESVSSNPPTKRQRTSRVVTRSSACTPTSDAGVEDTPNSDTPSPVCDLLSDTSTTPTDSIGLRPAGVRVGATGIGPGVTHDTRVPLATDADVRLAAYAMTCPDTDVEAVADTEVNAAIATQVNPAATTSTTHPATTLTTTSHPSSPPELSSGADKPRVPAFLISHGKGKREVNIFRYLDEVQDHRFRQILLYYILIESNDKSGVNGLLPTAKRPVEISQWTSRARPATLPEYMKGGRTFSDFVDSIITWWGSIQPPWRSFERETMVREVREDWGALYAPRINGLLNVVVLVYWWIRILEEDEPKDGSRADYEQFTDDVAWVFSHLTT